MTTPEEGEWTQLQVKNKNKERGQQHLLSSNEQMQHNKEENEYM